MLTGLSVLSLPLRPKGLLPRWGSDGWLVKGGDATGWNPKTYIFYYFFPISLLLPLLYPFLNPKPPNPNPTVLDLHNREKEKNKKRYLRCCECAAV